MYAVHRRKFCEKLPQYMKLNRLCTNGHKKTHSMFPVLSDFIINKYNVQYLRHRLESGFTPPHKYLNNLLASVRYIVVELYKCLCNLGSK